MVPGSKEDLDRQMKEAMRQANSPTCLQTTFASPMTFRQLAETQCQVTMGDCASRCETRWRHWPNPGHKESCLALCKAQQESCVAAAQTLPPRIRQCPYNEVDDEQLKWRETAPGSTGYPWRNIGGSIGSYGVGTGTHPKSSVSGAVETSAALSKHGGELAVLLLGIAVLVVGTLTVIRRR